MARLLWDQVGERLYETGIDRGVLYLPRDNGVAWNGLTGVDEDTSNDKVEPTYFDGIKFNDSTSIGDFEATLKAFTYPDEFLEYEGIASLGAGLYVNNQRPKLFGLSYRTLVGNDVEGLDFGYKVHLLYNLTAVPDPVSRQTISDAQDLNEFSWKIAAVPETAPGHRPTAHVILDSRFLPAELLEQIEDILYGTEGFFPGETIYDGGPPPDMDREVIDGGGPGSDGEELPGSGALVSSNPRLPSISELLDLIIFYGPRIIVPDTVNGLAELIHGVGDLTPSNVPGIYSALPDTHLVESSVPGFYVLVL